MSAGQQRAIIFCAQFCVEELTAARHFEDINDVPRRDQANGSASYWSRIAFDIVQS